MKQLREDYNFIKEPFHRKIFFLSFLESQPPAFFYFGIIYYGAAIFIWVSEYGPSLVPVCWSWQDNLINDLVSFFVFVFFSVFVFALFSVFVFAPFQCLCLWPCLCLWMMWVCSILVILNQTKVNSYFICVRNRISLSENLHWISISEYLYQNTGWFF